MPMQSPRDLFLYELSALHSSEQMIAQMLPMLAQEASDPQVQQGLEHHLEETQQQISNLEQVFQQLGAQPMQVQSMAVDGLRQDHDTFLQQQPSEQALTGFIVAASAKTEHFEMACYRGLVQKAQAMGEQEVVQLLQQNLQQEETMAQKVEQISQQLSQQMIGQMGGETGQQASLQG